MDIEHQADKNRQNHFQDMETRILLIMRTKPTTMGKSLFKTLNKNTMHNEHQAYKNGKIIILDMETATLWTISTKQTRIGKSLF